MLVTCTDTREETAAQDCRGKAAQRCRRSRTVRRRLAEGWYDRDDLLDIVVERILIDLTLA